MSNTKASEINYRLCVKYDVRWKFAAASDIHRWKSLPSFVELYISLLSSVTRRRQSGFCPLTCWNIIMTNLQSARNPCLTNLKESCITYPCAASGLMCRTKRFTTLWLVLMSQRYLLMYLWTMFWTFQLARKQFIYKHTFDVAMGSRFVVRVGWPVHGLLLQFSST